ncbi:GspE/PulE family protein [Clostridium sp. SYSU_GA19001]|uniref:GspE/PulE family protein n=1 Tax=Clostridium caldaquaticum TaxID=2940653 RepID=UPI0020778CF8|nr:GspE/PulE family protein [Clostridium caldaquaticum]MCM8711504.1 GspE/PulE family protein [Clostridium caldaquaticum]
MKDISKKRLGDLLVEAGKISREQLEQVLRKQRTSGKRIGELLIEDSIITEDDILDVLELQLGIQRVRLDKVTVNMEAVKSIPESLASRYTLIPIAFDKNNIKVVMADPLNIFALDDVKIASGYEVDPLIARSDEIKTAIDKYYSSQFVQKAAEDLSREQNARETDDAREIEDIRNAPAVRLADSIIKNAVKSRASDIHIEPFEKYIKIRFRIDGELQEVLKSPKETAAALVTRIKIMANMNIAEKRLPQDGRILTNVDGKEFDLRVSVLPTIFGEKIVIRLLNRESFLIDKEGLGIIEDDLDKLNRIVKNPYGIILVTGPTGSGKSTTLYSILNDLNNSDRNIVTVEDPVEYMIEGINQVNVNPKAGLTFASGLRAILRQDPDVIMIGEIRDNETAEIAIRAAITGHLVLSTIHTNDAASAVIRLTDMKIEPYLVATSIAGVVSQRLVRKICPYCKVEYKASDYEKRLLGEDDSKNIILYKGTGCALCNQSGYIGRQGVYEIMEITREHREYIARNKTTDELRDLSIKQGMKTLRISCKNLVLKGITTLDELVKIAYLKE